MALPRQRRDVRACGMTQPDHQSNVESQLRVISRNPSSIARPYPSHVNHQASKRQNAEWLELAESDFETSTLSHNSSRYDTT